MLVVKTVFRSPVCPIAAHVLVQRFSRSYSLKTRPNCTNNPVTAPGSSENDGLDQLAVARPYEPPTNVHELIKDYCVQEMGVESEQFSAAMSNEVKVKLLKHCYERLKHQVPNADLNTVATVDDVLGFYSSSVDARLSMQRLADDRELTPNVHVQQQVARFVDDRLDKPWAADRDVYQDRDTIVTSLWYGRKYKGLMKQR